MQIAFSLKWKDFFMLAWLIGLCMLLSLSLGSITEVEPTAAKMFGILALLWTGVAYPMYKWRNK